MNEQRPTEFIALEKSPNEIIVASHRELSDEAKAALEYISHDGMGIINLKELNPTTHLIEHSPHFSGTNIVRYYGYLASKDWDSEVKFLQPDGRLHDIQLDNPQAD